MRVGTIATSSFAHTAYVTSLLHNVCKKASSWWGNSVHMRWESNEPIWFPPSWCPTLFTLFILFHIYMYSGYGDETTVWVNQTNSLSMLLNLYECILLLLLCYNYIRLFLLKHWPGTWAGSRRCVMKPVVVWNPMEIKQINNAAL